MNVDAILSALGGRFVEVEPLSEGRTGATFRARDTEQGREGVLKVLEAELGRGSEGMRLKRELTRQLDISHPNLALPTATGEAAGHLWLFRDHVEGESLRARLTREGPLPVTESLAIVAQIASGLDELHRGGMLHRDLSPGHVILCGNGEDLPRVVLLDASIAPPVDATPALDLRGTPEYASPEQVRGKLVSFRSDLYSLGCLLYELLTGAPPFTGDAATVLDQHAKAPPPPPPDQLPDGGKLLVSLLSKEPRERPFSAQQVRRTLDPFLPDALRQGAAGGPRRAVPGVAVPRPAVPKQTLVGVPPMQRDAADPSPAEPPAPATAEAPDASEDWEEDHTQQIDAQDLLEVAQAPRPKVSVPPPAPGVANPPSAPPPPPRPSSAPPPPPRPSSVPPPLPPSGAPARVASDGPDPHRPLPKGPPVPAEHRNSEPSAPLALARVAGPLWVVGAGAFLLGALLSGTVVYVVMSATAGPEVALAPVPTAVSAPDVPAPPAEGPSAAAQASDEGAPDEALAEEDEDAADEADEEDEALAEEEADEPAAEEDEADEADEAPAPEAEPARDERAAAAERERRLRAQRQAQAARRRRQQQAQQQAQRRAQPKPAAKPGKSAFEQAREDAREAFRKRDYAAAARAYERATKANPKHAGSFAGLGAARLAQGNARGAVAAYQQAVRLQPRHAGFHVALGRALQTAGDKAGAKRAYQKALSLDPSHKGAQAALKQL